MNKRQINILVDEGFSNDYLKFLNIKYDVKNVVSFDEVRNGRANMKLDLIVFTGGEDIDPSVYGQTVGKYTKINRQRDVIASDIFYQYSHIPKLGICRGSQFLCAMSGGKLVQHVTGHTRDHVCEFKTENGYEGEFQITSTHHQMMYPFSLQKNSYELIAWSKKYLSDTYLDGTNEEMQLDTKFLEPEIVYFKNTKSLCIQGHPEFAGVNVDTLNVVFNLIENYLFNK